MIDTLYVNKFRCFGEEQAADIKPITLLVGENSTGKTSVLGAYRALHQVLSRGNVNFNRHPFRMGAFSDMVHKHAGKEFSIGYISLGDKVARKTVFSFAEQDTDTVVSAVRIEFGEGRHVRVALGGKDRLTVSFPKGGKVTVSADIDDYFDFVDQVERLLHAVLTVDSHADGKGGRKGGVSGGLEADHWWNRYFPAGDIVRLRGRMRGSAVMDDLRKLLHAGLKNSSRRSPGSRAQGIRLKGSVFPRPAAMPPVVAIAPIRSEPRRTYDPVQENGSANGEFAATEMLRLKVTDPEQWESLSKSLVDFGKESGMFTRISVKNYGGLADPYKILVGVRNAKQDNLVDVGYGVSQALPMLVELLREGNRKKTVLLQQPEVHLHPKGQVALASLLAETCKANQSTFIVETHNDFIVDRIRLEARKGRIDPSDVSILYFSPDASRRVQIHNISLDEQGEMKGVPPNYRKFFLGEMSRLLGFE